MISITRRLLNSRIGVYIGLGFIALIALAFAAGDITNLGNMQFGGSGTVAKTGGEKLSNSELQQRVQRVFEGERQQNPTLTIEQMIEQGAVEQIEQQLVTGLAVLGFTRQQGMVISKRLIDGEIASIPAFQGASGAFSQDVFREAIARQGLSEAAIRADINREVAARLLLAPTGFGTRLPNSLVMPYASLLLEGRQGRVAAIPASSFMPKAPPSDATLTAYYRANGDRFTIPERRTIRYAVIDTSRFDKAAEPADAEIAAYYEKNKARYAARETRSIEQLILPTQAAAQRIADQLAKGGSLASAASGAGLSTSTIADQAASGLASQTSAEVARAVFAAQQGALVGPIRTGLGWTLARVSAIKTVPAQSLAEVRSTIAATLREEKVHSLLSEFTSKIEDQAADGTTFDELVKDRGLTAETTPAITASGANPDNPAAQPSDDVKALLAAAFEVDPDGDPVLATIVENKRFAIVDVTNVTPAAPPPLEKVKEAVTQMYMLAEGNKKAKAVADDIVKKVRGGKTLEEAVREAGGDLPPVQPVSARRSELMRSQQVPPPLALLFSIPEGTVRSLDIGQDRGFMIVRNDKIERGDASKQPELVNATRSELQNVVGSEFTEQFARAVEKHVGVKRYPAARDGVKAQLRSANGAAQ